MTCTCGPYNLGGSATTYAMMVFKILKKICKGMTDAISHFCGVMTMKREGFIGKLGGNYVFRRVKEAWALGFFHSFNLAMLAKQVWRLRLPMCKGLESRILPGW